MVHFGHIVPVFHCDFWLIVIQEPDVVLRGEDELVVENPLGLVVQTRAAGEMCTCWCYVSMQ